MRTESGQQPPSESPPVHLLISGVIATFFGIGRLRPGPGTWGSLAALLVWWVLSRLIPANLQTITLAALVALSIAAGIPAATSVARRSGIKDPQFVVIDEVSGQWITLLAAPVTWKTTLAGFILFRGFDIFKPPPARQLERLPDGTGIVLDDVAAGIYALLIVQLLLYLRLL